VSVSRAISKKSKKTFVDESGIEWECSIYCPGFRNCKDQCCDKGKFKGEDKNKKVGLAVKDKVRLSHAGESKAVPMNPATGVVIALLISVVLAVAGFITLKMNKIINTENRIMNAQKRQDQENVDHHNDAESQEDLESLGSSNIAQPSDAEQESTAESSRLVDALPMTKITVVTYNKDLRSIDFSPRLVNK